MKPYIFKILALSLIFVLGAVSLAEATTVRIPNPLIHESFTSLLDAIITFLAFYLGPPIATIMLIVAGFYFVTAAGDPAKIEKAKKIKLAFNEAEKKGLGVVSLGSKMIDPPVVKRALHTIDLAIASNLLNPDWKN